MSEPYLPVPDPEPNSYWDPEPPHCPECGVIIDARPTSRKDGSWEGTCERHGTVVASFYGGDSQTPENEEERTFKGRCLNCGDEWVELTAPAICPECHSLDVLDVTREEES